LNASFGGQVDAVRRRAIEGPIALIVMDPRAGVGQDLLASLGDLEGRMLPGLVGRNAVDLLCVENGVHTVDQPSSLFLFARFSRFIRLRPVRLDFPEFNLGTFRSLTDLPPVLCGLTIRHPPRIVKAAPNRRCH
jgi:hypothetical protein